MPLKQCSQQRKMNLDGNFVGSLPKELLVGYSLVLESVL
jgi:hypothetical protein